MSEDQYSLLSEINSPFLSNIYKSPNFSEIKNVKRRIYSNDSDYYDEEHSFDEIYTNIVALSKGENIVFWKQHPELPSRLHSFFVDFYCFKYYACHVTITNWFHKNNKDFLDRFFTNHFDYDFLDMYQDEIEKLFGSKWIVHVHIRKPSDMKMCKEACPNLQCARIYYKMTSLSELPVGIDIVKRLIIRNNYVTSLEGMPNMPHLEILEIDQNPINSLVGMPEMPKLHTLNLSENKIRSFEGLSSSKTPCLTELIVNGNYIRNFDGFLINLNILTHLDISNNLFDSIDDIPDMPNLERLCVTKCGLTSLEVVSKFTKLKDLSVDNNRITSFKGLENLMNLERLMASKNHLGSFEYFPDAPKLWTLVLDDNHFPSFKGMPLLRGLKHISMYLNELTSFEGFSNPPYLKFLNVSYNRLTNWKGVEELQHLDSVIISDNDGIDCEPMPRFPKLKYY